MLTSAASAAGHRAVAAAAAATLVGSEADVNTVGILSCAFSPAWRAACHLTRPPPALALSLAHVPRTCHTQVEPALLAGYKRPSEGGTCNTATFTINTRCNLGPELIAKLNETGIGNTPTVPKFYGRCVQHVYSSCVQHVYSSRATALYNSFGAVGRPIPVRRPLTGSRPPKAAW